MGRPGFGFSLVIITLLLGVVLVLMALPNYVKIHHHSDRDWIPGDLRTIASAQDIFRERDKDGNGVLDYGTLAALASSSLLVGELATGTHRGYSFEVKPGQDAQVVWWAIARPVTVDADHDCVFFTNQAGDIFRLAASHPGAKGPPDTLHGDPPLGAIKVGDRCRPK